jgi:hypothetical protein
MCRFSYHGVLAHQDNTLTTKGMSNLVHLLGADIVDGDDEDALVLSGNWSLADGYGFGERRVAHERSKRSFSK